jgi:hypothetical protein
MTLKSLVAVRGAGKLDMNFRSACTFLLMATCLVAQTTWAQSPDKFFEKKTLPNDCAIWLYKTHVPTEILSYEGTCKDKLAAGDWLFGAHQPERAAPDRVVDGTVYFGRLANAVADSGLWMTFFSDRGGVTVYNETIGGVPSVSFMKGFTKADAGFSKLELAALIDKAIAVSREKRLPAPGRDKLLSVANQWYDAPQPFTDRWLKPLQSNTKQTDDPKVFGRSARGG